MNGHFSHVNKRTQYERPSYAAYLKNNEPAATTQSYPCAVGSSGGKPNTGNFQRHSALSNSNASSSHPTNSAVVTFTRDPSQLQGELLTTRIIKGPKGLGFTLIGNDGSSLQDEFLQIKNVIPGGPAHRDGILQMGDILVFVNNDCVLGATQAQACQIFQSIGVGELVTLQICRGYPLLFDPKNKV
ncbi:unnamed protein product, partial [Gongylonema pulchrum]